MIKWAQAFTVVTLHKSIKYISDLWCWVWSLWEAGVVNPFRQLGLGVKVGSEQSRCEEDDDEAWIMEASPEITMVLGRAALILCDTHLAGLSGRQLAVNI